MFLAVAVVFWDNGYIEIIQMKMEIFTDIKVKMWNGGGQGRSHINWWNIGLWESLERPQDKVLGKTQLLKDKSTHAFCGWNGHKGNKIVAGLLWCTRTDCCYNYHIRRELKRSEKQIKNLRNIQIIILLPRCVDATWLCNILVNKLLLNFLNWFLSWRDLPPNFNVGDQVLGSYEKQVES